MAGRTLTLAPCGDYADLADRGLAAALAEEDAGEEHGLNPFDRTTCRTHRRWVHQCVASPAHVVVVTGHRWCRRCLAVAQVMVDELTGAVAVFCPQCRRAVEGPATRQIIRTCRQSLARARHRPEPPVRAAGCG
jgi:hypothetical protein